MCAPRLTPARPSSLRRRPLGAHERVSEATQLSWAGPELAEGQGEGGPAEPPRAEDEKAGAPAQALTLEDW